MIVILLIQNTNAMVPMEQKASIEDLRFGLKITWLDLTKDEVSYIVEYYLKYNFYSLEIKNGKKST